MTDAAIIRPATTADLPAIAELARRVWHAHYPGIISSAQIDYMLNERYNLAALQTQITGDGQWLDLLQTDAAIIGFAQYGRLTQDELKLDKLYLLETLHGQGYGSLMLRHVDRRATDLGFGGISLAVNKQNHKAIQAYLRHGYQIRDSKVTDIGQGFVMDDYVMAKTLPQR